MEWRDLYVAGVTIVAWCAATFVGKPLVRFIDMRAEVRRSMILYANVRARWKASRDPYITEVEAVDPPLNSEEIERLREAEIQYRSLAADLRAFADTQPLASWILKRFGFDPRKASSGLVGMSNSIDTYGATRAFQTKTLNEALGFKD